VAVLVRGMRGTPQSWVLLQQTSTRVRYRWGMLTRALPCASRHGGLKWVMAALILNTTYCKAVYEDVSKSFRTESITKYTLTTVNTR
jgi:hypothetical protein